MDSKVTYESLPRGERRSVILAHPLDADPAVGRISVLSPVGVALLGRSTGARVAAELPGERTLVLRIVDVERNREALAA
jgi:regulator of nucleoside diphosphate kinase